MNGHFLHVTGCPKTQQEESSRPVCGPLLVAKQCTSLPEPTQCWQASTCPSMQSRSPRPRQKSACHERPSSLHTSLQHPLCAAQCCAMQSLLPKYRTATSPLGDPVLLQQAPLKFYIKNQHPTIPSRADAPASGFGTRFEQVTRT